MLFRNSISKTKKFFHKTLQSVKSLFSGDYYQRLPKTPPHSLAYTDMMNVQPNYKELDKFYSDFTDQWGLELDKDKAKKGNKKKTMSSSPSKQEKEVYNGNFMKFSQASSVKKNQIERKEEYNNHDDDEKKMKKSIVRHERKRNEDSCFKGKREVRTCLVAQKLKELEMLDMSNVDHLLDIEEVLHYYSRLTCPAYLDIVDKFFMDMYAEFFNGATTLTPAPTLRRRTVRS
jgi:hypothetical protein